MQKPNIQRLMELFDWIFQGVPWLFEKLPLTTIYAVGGSILKLSGLVVTNNECGVVVYFAAVLMMIDGNFARRSEEKNEQEIRQLHAEEIARIRKTQ